MNQANPDQRIIQETDNHFLLCWLKTEAIQFDILNGEFDPGSGCLLYTSDAADDGESVDLGGRRIIKKKKQKKHHPSPNKT